MKTKFILDTGSTIGATVMNPDLVTNIRPSEKPLLMSTNAGTKRLSLDAGVDGFGVAKFDNEQLANIFGFLHMVEKYSITYD